MTLSHPSALLLLLLPLGWIVFMWRRSVSHTGLLLKGAGFAAIVLALAEPGATLPRTRTGAVILVDTSNSITPDDLTRAGSLVKEMERHKRGNWMKIVPFAAQPRPLSPREASGSLHFVNSNNPAGDSTDLEAALTSSMSAIPAGYIPRLVLLSDGNENEGSSARAIAELQQLHVPVDTIPLSGRQDTGFRLESVSVPHKIGRAHV